LAVGASVVVATYTVGTLVRRRDALPALVLTLAGLAVQFGISGDLGGPADLVGVMIVVTAAWWLGDTLRTRREHAAALEARTLQHRGDGCASFSHRGGGASPRRGCRRSTVTQLIV
jgi:hypothetical protein